MSMDKLKKQMSENVGALNGLDKQNKSSNPNDNQNHNSNDNITDNNTSNTLEDRVQSVKFKGSTKRKIKNVTFGLYEDQQESIKEIADVLGLGINEFMRESADMIIDIFNNKLKG